jgi:hypothetical protein
MVELRRAACLGHQDVMLDADVGKTREIMLAVTGYPLILALASGRMRFARTLQAIRARPTHRRNGAMDRRPLCVSG